MKKYEELLKIYTAQIEKCKETQAAADAAKARLMEAEKKRAPSDGPEFELLHQWEKLQYKAEIEYLELFQAVEREYWNVPFSKARKQGIKRFLESAFPD